MRTVLSWASLAFTAVLGCQAQIVTEYPLATANSAPQSIVSGPDNALWFTEQGSNKIGRIALNGTITEYNVPTASSSPYGITLGPDGALWFTELNAGKIGRITPTGVFTEFPVPKGPLNITLGPDGNLWFTEQLANNIGRITTAGVVTEFAGATYRPTGITPGPDGNLWFTEPDAPYIGKITPLGSITEYRPGFTFTKPTGIVQGPDGNLWYTDPDTTGNGIGKITTGGVNQEFTIPTTNSFPAGITTGPDGNLWFTEGADQIGRITPQGIITEFPVPTSFSGLQGITTGPDGNLWFTESSAKGNSIGKFQVSSPACTIPAITISNTPWNAFAAPANSVVWLNAHTAKPKGLPTNVVTTVLFTGGSMVLNSVKYALPDGLLTFDPNAPATPFTDFNSVMRRWETTINPNHLSDEIFFNGSAIPVDANLLAGGKATVTYVVQSSDQTFSFSWQWSAGAYTSWPADWNGAQIEPYHGTLQAGAPLNASVEEALIHGPRGGAGANYTGSWSATGSAACSSH